MTFEPVWLEVNDIVALNERLVATNGDPFLIINQSGLESAVMAPVNYWYYSLEYDRDIVVAATTLCLSLARNHAFMQGNKRTAFVAMEVTLHLNGYVLDMPDDELRASFLTRAITHDLSDDDFTAEIDSYVHERSAQRGPEEDFLGIPGATDWLEQDLASGFMDPDVLRNDPPSE